MITQLMVIGEVRGPHAIELVAVVQPGVDPERIVTNETTEIAAVSEGETALVDRDGSYVRFVRGRAPPHPVDVARFDAVIAALTRAGFRDVIGGSSERALEAALTELGMPQTRGPRETLWNPREHVMKAFITAAGDEVFPMTWWHDDPEPGIDEMADLLARLGISKRFPRRELVVDAHRGRDQIDDEDLARDVLCGRLCEVANELLAAARSERRLCGPFWFTSDDDDPCWLVTRPHSYDVLVREQLVTPWVPARRQSRSPGSYVRPPDRGEIDMSKFPSGDDPF